MAAGNLALQILISAKDTASAVLGKIRQSITQTGADTGRFGQNARGAQASIDNFSGAVGGLSKNILGLAASYASLSGLKNALTAILETGGKFETLKTQMSALMGSIAEGDKAFAWVKDFATRTPLSLEAVSAAFVKLKAYGLDPMDGTLQALTDQTSKLGGSQETLNGIVLALGQAWSKQKLQAEEINQLVERGVPVWDLLAEVTGKNTAELAKLSEQGALGRDVIAGLITEIGRSSDGASAAMMSNWTGLVSNLSDSWQQFLDKIAQSGALDYAKRQVQGLLDTISEAANNGDLERTARSISDFFVGIAETFKGAAAFVRDFAAEFKALAAVVVGAKIAGAISSIGVAAGAAAGGVGALAGAMARFAGLARAGIYGALASELFKIAQAYEQTKAIEAQTATVGDDLAKKNAALKDSYAALSDELGVSIKSMKDLDKAVAAGLVTFNEQSGAWESTAQAVRDYDAEIKTIASDQEQALSAFGKTVEQLQAMSASTYETLAKFKEWSSGTQDAAASVADALQKVTDSDLAAMKKSLEDAFAAGTNRTDELNTALSSIKTEEVSRAFKALGVESSQSIRKSADDAAAAYQKIVNSGTATARDLEAAWNAYIKKIDESNAALNAADEQTKARQAAIGAIDNLGGAGQDASIARNRQLVEQGRALEQAVNEGRIADARRIAQEREDLAQQGAIAEAEASKTGERSASDAYLAREKYLQMIRENDAALQQLIETEKAVQAIAPSAPAPNAPPSVAGNILAPGAQDQASIAAMSAAVADLQTKINALKEPVTITIMPNFSAMNAELDAVAQRIATVKSMSNAATTVDANAPAADNQAAVQDALQTEVDKRGSRV